jgi:hypothetical protein
LESEYKISRKSVFTFHISKILILLSDGRKQKFPLWKTIIIGFTYSSANDDIIMASQQKNDQQNKMIFTKEDIILIKILRQDPVDYQVWGVLPERVYRSRIGDVDHLRERLIEEWHRFDQGIVDRAVQQWRVRLEPVSTDHANGGHFEYKL